MKKLKLSKTGKILIVAIVLIAIGSYFGNKYYKEYLYKQTYEYKLLEKGYSEKEVKQLEKLFDNKELEHILAIDVNENIIKVASSKYYKNKYLDDYLSYIDENSVKPEYAIMRINTFTNYNFYEHDIKARNYSENMIVNKYYLLKEDYVPDLVNISSSYAWGTDNKATKETLDAFIEMRNACEKETGISLMINSAYRSYQEQETVYNTYLKSYDEEYADSIAARPGHSEHQTGLSLDIFSTKDRSQKTFAEGDTYKWLKDNSYKYGFIIRYPEGKEDITGFAFEAWHYRYIGKDIAKYIYDNDITYEEYYAYYIDI